MGVSIDTSLLHEFKFFLGRGILIFGADEAVFNVTADGGTKKSGFLRYKSYTELSVDNSLIEEASNTYQSVDEAN